MKLAASDKLTNSRKFINGGFHGATKKQIKSYEDILFAISRNRSICVNNSKT